MNKTQVIFIATICLLITACDNQQSQIQRGKELFHKVHIGKNNAIGCISCHSLKTDIKTVGPSLYGIGLRADKIVEGLTAEQYLTQSITNPDGYIVSGYTPAIMFAHYKTELSKKQIQDLVSFLNNLK